MARNGRFKDLNYKYLNRRPARQEGPAMSHMTEHARDTTQARRFVRRLSKEVSRGGPEHQHSFLMFQVIVEVSVNRV